MSSCFSRNFCGIPEHSARSSTASFLPPAPTLSGSHTRVNCEPEITTARVETSELDDEVEKVLDDEGLEEKALDEELDDEVVPPLSFGPPKGRTRSVASQSKENINSNFFLYSTLSHLIIILVSNLLESSIHGNSVACETRTDKFGIYLYMETMYRCKYKMLTRIMMAYLSCL